MPQKKSGGTRGHKCVAGRLTSFGHSPLSIGLPRDLYKLPVVFHIARDGSKTKLDEMHFIANEISLRSTDVEARRDMLDVKFSVRVNIRITRRYLCCIAILWLCVPNSNWC